MNGFLNLMGDAGRGSPKNRSCTAVTARIFGGARRQDPSNSKIDSSTKFEFTQFILRYPEWLNAVEIVNKLAKAGITGAVEIEDQPVERAIGVVILSEIVEVFEFAASQNIFEARV